MSTPIGPGQDLDSLIAARRRALSQTSMSSGADLDSLIRSRRQAIEAAKPGVIERAATGIREGLTRAVEHPFDTAIGLVTTPLKSAYDAVVSPGVGQMRPDARLSKGGNSSGRAIDTAPYDAQHGGITTGQRTAAGIQSVLNIATPSLFGGLKTALAPTIGNKLGTTAALSSTGAALGAAYNPNDPAAGALTGGVLTPLVGGTVAGATRAVNAGRRLSALSNRVKTATPLDESALAQSAATEAADRANYGRAEAEGVATGGTSQALADVFGHETIKPYIDMVRESPKYRTAPDATVARRAYTLISRDRRAQQKLAVNAQGEYNPKADMKAEDLADAARLLRDATAETGTREIPAPETAQSPAPSTREALQNFRDRQTAAFARNAGTIEQRMARTALERHGAENIVSPPLRGAPTPGVEETPAVMPSFPAAVAEHARMKGNRAAFNEGAKQTALVMRGTKIAPEKLDYQGRAAFLNRIAEMAPEEADYALRGTLGSAQREIVPVLPSLPITAATTATGAMFGGGPGALISGLGGAAATAGSKLSRNITRLGRLSPIVDALDARAGNQVAAPLDPATALRLSALADAFATAPDFSQNRTRRPR